MVYNLLLFFQTIFDISKNIPETNVYALYISSIVAAFIIIMKFLVAVSYIHASASLQIKIIYVLLIMNDNTNISPTISRLFLENAESLFQLK